MVGGGLPKLVRGGGKMPGQGEIKLVWVKLGYLQFKFASKIDKLSEGNGNTLGGEAPKFVKRGGKCPVRGKLRKLSDPEEG